MNNKVETYIGFAIKKGAVVFGCDQITRYRKKIYLLLSVKTLSDNSLEKLQQVALKRNLPLLEIDDCEILNKKNCKALAVCDKSLADAIIQNLTLIAGR